MHFVSRPDTTRIRELTIVIVSDWLYNWNQQRLCIYPSNTSVLLVHPTSDYSGTTVFPYWAELVNIGIVRLKNRRHKNLQRNHNEDFLKE